MNEITVGCNDIYGPNNYLAVLAHEVSHAFQFSAKKGDIFESEDDSEQFTDALTFYLGFGRYTELGKHAKKVTTKYVGAKKTETITRTYTLGYLSESYFADLRYAVNRLFMKKEAAKEEATKNAIVIKEIGSLLSAYRAYLDSGLSLIEKLKTKGISQSSCEDISVFLTKYDERSFSAITALTGPYQQRSYAENTQTTTELRKRTKEIFEAYNKLMEKRG